MSGGPGRLAALVAALLLAACTSAASGAMAASGGGAASGAGAASEGSAPAGRRAPSSSSGQGSRDLIRSPAALVGRTPTKVLLVMEENSTFSDVLSRGRAPYLSRLASTYATAVNARTGDRLRCPSLPSYILVTSGTTAGICDDRDPSAHRLRQDNVFRQMDAAHRAWRVYAEATPEPCARRNSGAYAVRHVPSTYYTDLGGTCASGTVAVGDAVTGELARRTAAGTLPGYAMLVPDVCHDMHGSNVCPGRGNVVAAGDAWLRQRLAPVLAGPDFRTGRLVVVIAWDEGSDSSDHVPLLVLHRDLHRVRSATRVTGCSVLRATEEVQRLPLLGCARTAASLLAAVGLRP